MIKTATIAVLLCLAFPTLIWGQGETSNWYFGNGAGITFNGDGTVTPTTNGKLNTFEGCASISDPAGDLLFYTDGITVYDQNHDIMQNGGGLLGDPSSTQSALIVPKPGDPDLFYIFTVDTAVTEDDPDRGLNYTTVDISLNGGNGAVIEKNIPLLVDCSEKIAAVIKDCSDQSIWLITLASTSGAAGLFNTYHAFEINTTGVVFTSVKSTFNDLVIEDPRGYLKVASDGTKMVSANVGAGLFLYDFDAKTGIASNQQRIQISGAAQASYGVEFSPNSRYLYVHASNNQLTETGHLSYLLQYDLEAVDISASQEILDDRPIFRGALQLGNNGKIYRTIAKNYDEGTPFLGVINKPNSKGIAADYQHNAISLGGKNATQGLPPFIQSFFNKIDLITDADGNKISSLALCSGEGFKLEAEDIPGATYTWEKDGVPLSNSSTNILEIATTANTDSGRYRLEVTLVDPLECPVIGEALIEVSPLPETKNILLTQCDVDTNSNEDGITTFDLEQLDIEADYDITFYENLQDRVNDNPILNPEKYQNSQAFNQTIFYKVVNSLGCEDFGEITLEVHPTAVSPSTLSPLMACDEIDLDGILESSFDLEAIRQNVSASLEVTFYANLDDLLLEENPLIGNYESGTSTIYVRLEKDNQCLGVERLELIVNPLPEFDFENSYQVCSDGEALLIDAPIGFDSYVWYGTEGPTITKLSDTASIAISEGGTYSIEVGILYENNGQTVICTTTKDFTVIQSNRATFQEINITDATDNNSVEIVVSGDGDYEYSLDGEGYQEANNFENIDAGFYTVFVRDKNGCGIAEDDIAVIGFPKFFTPNGDGSNDSWQIIGVDNKVENAEIAIFDRYGKLMKQLTLDDPGWDGTFNGQLLPPADYWFSIAFGNGKEFKGHFSLKR